MTAKKLCLRRLSAVIIVWSLYLIIFLFVVGIWLLYVCVLLRCFVEGRLYLIYRILYLSTNSLRAGTVFVLSDFDLLFY